MSWVVIPNWDKFQHYRDRNPVWMKLYFELNSRDDWRQLTFAQRGLLVSIWLEYGRSNARLRAETVWQRVGQRDNHGNLKALIDAGFIRIRARRPLALARSQEKKYLRTSSKKERRPLAEAAADTPPEKETTMADELNLPDVDMDALEKIKELQANLFPLSAVTAWKDLERRVAKALGGQRSGPQGKHASDTVGTRFAVECKRTTRYQLRHAWIDQARRQARQEGNPWLLVISEHRSHRPIVVLDFWEFADIAQQAGLIPATLDIGPE